jgi:hypothetical protein
LTLEEHAAQLKKEYYKENPDADKSIEWFINAESNKPTGINDYKLDARYADDNVRYCPKCKTCWQNPSGFHTKTEYYENFPTIGKEKMICKRCSTNVQQD